MRESRGLFCCSYSCIWCFGWQAGTTDIFSWTRATWYRPGSVGIGAAAGDETDGDYGELAYSFETMELDAAVDVTWAPIVGLCGRSFALGSVNYNDKEMND